MSYVLRPRYTWSTYIRKIVAYAQHVLMTKTKTKTIMKNENIVNTPERVDDYMDEYIYQPFVLRECNKLNQFH